MTLHNGRVWVLPNRERLMHYTFMCIMGGICQLTITNFAVWHSKNIFVCKKSKHGINVMIMNYTHCKPLLHPHDCSHPFRHLCHFFTLPITLSTCTFTFYKPYLILSDLALPTPPRPLIRKSVVQMSEPTTASSTPPGTPKQLRFSEPAGEEEEEVIQPLPNPRVAMLKSVRDRSPTPER